MKIAEQLVAQGRKLPPELQALLTRVMWQVNVSGVDFAIMPYLNRRSFITVNFQLMRWWHWTPATASRARHRCVLISSRWFSRSEK